MNTKRGQRSHDLGYSITERETVAEKCTAICNNNKKKTQKKEKQLKHN